MTGLIAVSSWSGGKDSCFACYKAMRRGYQVKHLLNFISKEYKRCCFHGIEANLLKLQAESVGIPLVQKEVSPDMKEYEREFKQAVFELKELGGVRKMVFGDIYLEEHKTWVERVCKDLRIEPIEPLWGISPDKIVEDFINLGFKAIIVSCKAASLGKEFIGRYVDNDFLNELKEKNICPCGENGEFHTFVIDGPIFKKKIEIIESQVILKKGFWEYWFLDIKNINVREKKKNYE